MKIIPINREVIISRLDGIRKALSKLDGFKDYSFVEFEAQENFAVAEHYLRRALEAIFEIGNHILSRVPGVRATTYKEIARLLGENGFIPEEFGNNQLIKMAGYRNRLIHFYSEVKPPELLKIIKNDLQDIEIYCQYIIQILENPQKWKLEVI